MDGRESGRLKIFIWGVAVMKLKEALKILKEDYSEAVYQFIPLYQILGAIELHDGIYCAMEDAGHGEFMDELLEMVE